MKLLQKYLNLVMLVLALSWFPQFSSTAKADPDSGLEKAILEAASNISMSVDGLSQVISIDSKTLFELVRTYAPLFNQSVQSVTRSAEVFNDFFPTLANGANQVGITAEKVSELLPDLNHSTQALAASLQAIAENMDYFESLIKDSNTQIMIAIPVVIVSTAAVFYIGDCTIKILKTVYGWGKSFYGWCKKNPEDNYLYTSDDQREGSYSSVH